MLQIFVTDLKNDQVNTM